MRFASTHLDPDSPGNPGSGGPCPGGKDPAPGRLTLLLSTAPWRENPWAEALPQLLSPLGVFAVRATSARQAEKVIRSQPVHIAVVDLSIPLEEMVDPSQPHEDGGPRILELLSRLAAAPPTVVLKSPRQVRDDTRHMNQALRCNAFAVVDRTAADLEMMLGVMQRVLSRVYQNRWPLPPTPPAYPPDNFV